MKKLEGGFWIRSVNAHGSAKSRYHLYTAWHIKGATITVVYVNFAVAEGYTVAEFVKDSEEIVEKWGVEFVWMLQDGVEKLEGTVFPLLHFSHHIIVYLQRVIISYRAQFTVHIGTMFAEMLSLLARMQELLYRIECPMNNPTKRKEGDPILHSVFTREMINDFTTICRRTISAAVDDPTEREAYMTVEIVTGVMEVINLIHDRQNVTEEALLRENAAKIVTIINDELSLFFDPNYTKSGSYPNENSVATLGTYRDTLMRYPCCRMRPGYLLPNMKYRRRVTCSVRLAITYFSALRLDGNIQMGLSSGLDRQR